MPSRFVPPQSLRFVAEEVPSFIKARTHHRKADDLGAPHEVFLERWKGFEFLYSDVAPMTRKHDAAVFARDAGAVEVMTACLAQLSRPRLDQILSSADIPELNVVLSRKNKNALIGQNGLLKELGVDLPHWLTAQKDLRFALKANTQKGLHAICTLLLVVRAACDPKVPKTDNLVKDAAALAPANRLLKDCVVHLVEHFQKEADRFHEPAFRGPPRKV
ncbi:MAG: hypothetical protein ABIJ09_19055 [Pseudomonadota bacterium]